MVYVPDVTGKTDYIRIFGGDTFKNSFNGFVYRSVDNLNRVLFGAKGFDTCGNAPGRKRRMNIFGSNRTKYNFVNFIRIYALLSNNT